MTRILLIDDDAPFRELVRTLLEADGFAVLEAEDGEAGVALARTHLPDLILCDVQMDRMDGHATLDALHGMPETAALPCILMSAGVDAGKIREGMNRGADDYLPKPFTREELLAAVRARLARQRAVEEQADARVEAVRASLTTALPHELHTPLSGVLGSARILLEAAGELDAGEVRELAGMIHRAGLRLQHLIERALFHARLRLIAADAGHRARVRRAHLPNPHTVIVEAACATAEVHRRACDLRLEVFPYPLAIGAHFLEKMVAELVDNALKFSDPGTAVSLSMTPEGRRVRIRVTDRGRGMTPEQVARIEPYVQFERGYWEQQGTGLGLAIVGILAEIHGGRMHVAARPGEGTTVAVDLPRAHHAAGDREPRPAAGSEKDRFSRFSA